MLHRVIIAGLIAKPTYEQRLKTGGELSGEPVCGPACQADKGDGAKAQSWHGDWSIGRMTSNPAWLEQNKQVKN